MYKFFSRWFDNFTVVKLLLYLVCRRVQSPAVQALAQDHRNDVFANLLAIVCGYLGNV